MLVASNLGSIFLDRTSASTLGLPETDDHHHYQLCVYPPGYEAFSLKSVTILGVILSGVNNGNHFVMVLEDDCCAIRCNFECCTEQIFSCGSNTLIESSTPFVIHTSKTPMDLDIVLGMVVSESKTFIGFNRTTESIVHQRKRTLEQVTYKGNILRPQQTYEFAHKWIKYHSPDSVATENSDKIKVKNSRGVRVSRPLTECIEIIQRQTGRNFWYDVAEQGDVYNVTLKKSK